MRKTFLLFCCAFTLCMSGTSCNQTTVRSTTPDTIQNDKSTQVQEKMKINIGTSTFTVVLQDNPTVAAFKSLLPMTLNMDDLNGNEKHVDLARKLPTDASNPGTIHTGDLMLYGSSTLVLFYKTFSTSYSYTRIGRIEDVAGLATASGSGNVEVSFELER